MEREKFKLYFVESENKILKILNEFDNVFNPSLSSLIGDLTRYSQKLYRHAFVLEVRKDEKVVGFAAIYANNTVNKTAYLTQIAVNKNVQNKSVGKMLLNACISIAVENGMELLKLEVYNENLNAINFYKHQGFKFIDDCSGKSKYMIRNL